MGSADNFSELRKDKKDNRRRWWKLLGKKTKFWVITSLACAALIIISGYVGYEWGYYKGHFSNLYTFKYQTAACDSLQSADEVYEKLRAEGIPSIIRKNNGTRNRVLSSHKCQEPPSKLMADTFEIKIEGTKTEQQDQPQ